MAVLLKPWHRRLLLAAAGAAGFLVLVHLILFFMPYPELDQYRSRSYGLAVRDRNSRVLRVFPADDGVKREWAPLDTIPPGAVRVFIRSEDRRFYFHPGVDIISIAGSALRNRRAGRTVSGASTVTMQLARLIRPHGGGMRGKAGEAWDALRLEAKLSKKEILELYLNGIPFGSNIEGLPAMTRARFGRDINRLDDSQALLLAVVPRRPGLYDPANNPETAVTAAVALADRCGLSLSEGDLRRAALEASNSGDPEKAPFRAPHFTERLFQTIRSNTAVSAGEKGTPPVSLASTLDLGLQGYAEERLAAELSGLEQNRVGSGAMLAIENDTGAVRIYVGSKSWFDDESSGKIDGVRVLNQPGSCLKPFLYAMALDRGFTAAEILPDLPTIFGGGEAYIPSNFNRRFNGPVRLRLALASSLNIPAVYTLERLGVGAFEEYLVSLGFDSIRGRMGSHGTGLALGNAEVSLEELVRAFSAFPRGGEPAEFRWTGDDRYNSNIEGNTRSLMSSQAAWLISDILSDRASRFSGFGPAPSLNTPFSAMFKTGTANQFQHIWALGATRRFTVGVWMGNFSGETVVGRTGSSIPARIVSDILSAMEGSGETRFTADRDHPGGPVPAGLSEAAVCSLSGMAAGPFCGGAVSEWFAPGQEPGRCSWHRAAGTLVYPAEYQSWLTERFRMGGTDRESGGGAIRMPRPGSLFYLDPSLPPEAQGVRIETAGFASGAMVYLNGVLQGAVNQAGVFMLPLSRGQHEVIVEDQFGSMASVYFDVR
ncbi:penicillin-binding protein 1C [Breznakiella homolactica]|uniref:peptidoglycan glycosyltransferase n=1 Tax=Breznakiella homolactica TaxID=2798577 RepID=A0A7T8BAC9_9SPIR|nr:penicillin-binding protein 1C [Breznakiella homolactica]QQO10534.1 penicillin-binding protein 1C [Breznakiella homolactica]